MLFSWFTLGGSFTACQGMRACRIDISDCILSVLCIFGLADRSTSCVYCKQSSPSHGYLLCNNLYVDASLGTTSAAAMVEHPLHCSYTMPFCRMLWHAGSLPASMLLSVADVHISWLPLHGTHAHACWGAPLRCLGRPLQKSRHSAQLSSLKGVDPELFSPEELLGGPRRTISTSRPGYSSHTQTPPLHQRQSESQASDAQPSSSWFQLPWKVGQQDEGPSSRRISGEDRGVPLHQPPMVNRIHCATSHGHIGHASTCLSLRG